MSNVRIMVAVDLHGTFHRGCLGIPPCDIVELVLRGVNDRSRSSKKDAGWASCGRDSHFLWRCAVWESRGENEAPIPPAHFCQDGGWLAASLQYSIASSLIAGIGLSCSWS